MIYKRYSRNNGKLFQGVELNNIDTIQVCCIENPVEFDVDGYRVRKFMDKY